MLIFKESNIFMQLLTKCQILGQKSSPQPPPSPPPIPKMKSILFNYQVANRKRLITQSQYLLGQYPIPECQNQNSKCLEKSQYANYPTQQQATHEKCPNSEEQNANLAHNSNIQTTIMASKQQTDLISERKTPFNLVLKQGKT